ncbi:MAG TPA: hypothetical protein VF992_09590 [Thermoplasmata archaeon]
MASENLLRDSLIVGAMVILSASAAALTWNLIAGLTPAKSASPNAILVVAQCLDVIGLGFVLWRSQPDTCKV